MDENFIILETQNIKEEEEKPRKIKVWRSNSPDKLHLDLDLEIDQDWRMMKAIESKLVIWIDAQWSGKSPKNDGILIINLETGDLLRKFECPFADPLSDQSNQMILSDKIKQEINIGKMEINWDIFGKFNSGQHIRLIFEFKKYNFQYNFSFLPPDNEEIQIIDFASFIEKEAD